jgi:DnaJ-related protein SCJ1
MVGYEEFSLFIEKGIKDHQTIRFTNAGNEYADKGASDVVF